MVKAAFVAHYPEDAARVKIVAMLQRVKCPFGATGRLGNAKHVFRDGVVRYRESAAAPTTTSRVLRYDKPQPPLRRVKGGMEHGHARVSFTPCYLGDTLGVELLAAVWTVEEMPS
jgi:hypothetical protein